MDLRLALMESSAGVIVTDKDFKVIWGNAFEEEYYKIPVIGLDVVDCHKEENKDKIRTFLQEFKTGQRKSFTKVAVGMLITYSSYYIDGEFAGVVRTRIRMID